MSEDKRNNWSRRDLLKGMVGMPIVGSVWWAGASKGVNDTQARDSILKTLNINASPPLPSGPMSGDPIRIGIIGFGIRGPQLCRALGFAQKSWLASMAQASKKNPKDNRLLSFLEQEHLNVQITAICDLFDVRAQDAIDSFSTEKN